MNFAASPEKYSIGVFLQRSYSKNSIAIDARAHGRRLAATVRRNFAAESGSEA